MRACARGQHRCADCLAQEWWQNKTVAGTAAVFAFAWLSLDVPTLPARVGIAIVCAMAEAFGGKTFDNAFIALPALGSWIYYHGWR